MNAFKLFFLDTGLMGAMVEAPASTFIIGSEAFTEYKGAFTELFVCSQMQGTGIPLYYYSEENSRIELDFVAQIGGNVFPIEVKAEENLRSKSLKTFIDKNPDLHAIRLSMRHYIDQGWLENIPLYAFREMLERRVHDEL